MGKNPKKPKATERVSSRKRPRNELLPSYNEHSISWHISLMETVDPFGWHVIDRTKAHEIREKLSHFESQTWNEITVKSKDRNHSVPIGELCKRAQDRLVELNQDDIDELVSLRLSGVERVWGIRSKDIFRILWWDPNHQVCPSSKKNT